MGDARVEIFSFLNLMVEKAGSGLFFCVGAPVNLKIEGITHPLKMPRCARSRSSNWPIR